MRRDLFVVGFFVRRYTMKEGKGRLTRRGETIRDTITCFIPDTVRLSGEVRYEVQVQNGYGLSGCSDRGSEGTLKSTIED
ncbi:MAG: hypothetical protein ACLU4N_05305 [Butyricimonas faecihominis]